MLLIAFALAQSDPRPKPQPPILFDCSQGAKTSPPAPTASFPDPEVRVEARSGADFVTNGWSKGVQLVGAANDPDSRLGVCRAWYRDPTGAVVLEAVGRAWGMGGSCNGVAPIGGLGAGTYEVGLTFKDSTCNTAEVSYFLRLNASPSVSVSGPALVSISSSRGGEGVWNVALLDDVVLPGGTTATLFVVDQDGATVASATCTIAADSNPATCAVSLTGLEVGLYSLVATADDADGVGSTSAPLTVEVNEEAASVAFSSPSAGLTVEPGETFAIAAVVQDVWATTDSLVTARYEDEDMVASTIGDCTPADDDGDGVSACTVDEAFAFDENGTYTLWLEYDDGYGTLVTSNYYSVLVNDTPVVVTDGLESGVVVRPDSAVAVQVVVEDADAPSGSVTEALQHESEAAPTESSVALDVDGQATDSVTFTEAGTYTLWYAFADSAGAEADSTPITVYANYAPTIDLGGLSSTTETVYRADDTYTFSFTTADDDDDDLTVTCGMASVMESNVSIATDHGSNEGSLSCTLAGLTGLSEGTRQVTVTLTDDHETTTDWFWVQIAQAADSDADADTYTPNEGDCDDTDAAIHPGATDVCNGVSDDCDTSVNEDVGDEDSAGVAYVTGSVATLGSQGLEDDGSLAWVGDEDVWYFEATGDSGERHNIQYTVTLTVPEDADGLPLGDWSVVASTSEGGADRVASTPSCQADGACCVAGTCELAWGVEGDPEVSDEHDWWLVLTSTEWDESLCEDAAYTLRIEL